MTQSSTGLRSLTFASISQKVLGLLFFTFLSNFLGVEKTGDFTWAMAYTTIFGFFVDFGLAPAITRFVAARNHPDKSYFEWLAASWNFRLISAIGAYILVLASYLFIGCIDSGANFSWWRLSLLSISGLIMIGDNLIVWASSIWRGWHTLGPEAKATLSYQFFVTAIGAVTLYLTRDVFYLLLVYAIGSLSTAIWLQLKLWQSGFWLPLWSLKFTPIWDLLKSSRAIIVYGALIRGYNYFDSLLVDRLAGVFQLGLYGLANKIILALQFLPSTFSAKYYALFAHDFQAKKYRNLKWHFNHFLFTATVLGGLVALATFFGSPVVVKQIFPEFVESVDLIRILAFAIIAIFINFPLGAVLNATYHSAAATRNLILVFALNILIDWYFIPTYGALAAAWSAMICNWLFIALNANVVQGLFAGLTNQGETNDNLVPTEFNWSALVFAFVSSGIFGYISQLYLPDFLTLVLVCLLCLWWIWRLKWWQIIIKIFSNETQTIKL